MYKYGQELPKEVEVRLDAYIERIKKIDWFKPKEKLDKSAITKQVKVICKAFGLSASVEYRELKTEIDWDSAWDAARGAAWGAAWDAARGAALGAAWDAAWDAAWGAAWDAARDAAWGAAWDAAWGAYDELLKDNKGYSDKYPNGSFINLVPLYEMGLYPIGIVNGKFIIGVPVNNNK